MRDVIKLLFLLQLLSVHSENEFMRIEPKSLENMEALLAQSALGIHVLFDNDSIAEVLKKAVDDRELVSFENSQKIQVILSELVGKKSFVEKKAFLADLDQDSYELLIRTYFHIVDSTVLATTELKH